MYEQANNVWNKIFGLFLFVRKVQFAIEISNVSSLFLEGTLRLCLLLWVLWATKTKERKRHLNLLDSLPSF